MRLISEKNKNDIGKRLSAIYYIVTHGFEIRTEEELESMAKIIEHVCSIAFAVGGERFATIELPAYFMRLSEQMEVSDELTD